MNLLPALMACFIAAVASLFGTGVPSASGFVLLGPFTSWMTADLGYQNIGWIGGPASVGNGYRWNVPVVTYGFDPSFTDYFGSNGVSAVESAMQELNDLPPASVISLNDYPFQTWRMNYRALATNLIDLKSWTLSLMLEHMGLYSPDLFTFSLRAFTDPTDYTIITNNIDPVDIAPSYYVNGALYWYRVQYTATTTGYSALAESYPVDPADSWSHSVADGYLTAGSFYSGLTFDDVGGLRYLLDTNNIAFESLIPGVTGYGMNASNYVVSAPRPGVDKITFARMNYDPTQGRFASITNQWVDSFVTNNTVQQQTVERVITQPDILFTAQDLGYAYFSRTGTANWINNGLPLNQGPGVIQPPVTIDFNRLGPNLVHYYGTAYAVSNLQTLNPSWGSYDTNITPPFVYSGNPSGINSTVFHFWLSSNPSIYNFTTALHSAWTLPGLQTDQFLLETSTNLADWVSLATITNLGGTFNYFDFVDTNIAQRYFRTVKQ